MLRSMIALALSVCAAGLSRPAAPARVANPSDQIRTAFTAEQFADWPQRQVDEKPCRVSPAVSAPADYELNHHRITVRYSGDGTVEVSLAHHSVDKLDQAIKKRHLHSRFQRAASGREIRVVSPMTMRTSPALSS